jgi:hypothetical protein
MNMIKLRNMKIDSILTGLFLITNVVGHFTGPSIGAYGGSFSLNQAFIDIFLALLNIQYNILYFIFYILFALLLYKLLRLIDNKILKLIVFIIGILISIPFMNFVE